jgi:hypothetical protein
MELATKPPIFCEFRNENGGVGGLILGLLLVAVLIPVSFYGGL